MSAATYLSVDELAAELGVKPCFIRRLVWERRIPYYKVGKYIRFKLSEVLEWMECRRMEPLR